MNVVYGEEVKAGKEREIKVGELVESIECVNKIFHIPARSRKNQITYQLGIN
jgi:hypothetical protein